MKTAAISAVVCTFKREKYLRAAVESLLSQETKGLFSYEVLVVDNSPDASSAPFIKQFNDSKIKFIHEPRVGLSFARNRGIQESTGNIVAFMDDDAIADSNWLYHIYNSYCENKDAVCVGGKVEMLAPEGMDTSWIPQEFLGYLSIVDFGQDTFAAHDHTEYPIGVNISFKRSVFDKVGFFNTRFGRKGQSLLSCEDSEFCFNIQKNYQEGKIYYNPNAIVKHTVLEERLTRSWFLRRLYWQGISECLFERHAFGRKKTLSRFMRNIIAGIPHKIRNFLYYRFKKNDKLAFYFKAMLYKDIGYVQEVYDSLFFGDRSQC
jgi:glycosyltransferase involved in cell wall biosynthesis